MKRRARSRGAKRAAGTRALLMAGALAIAGLATGCEGRASRAGQPAEASPLPAGVAVPGASVIELDLSSLAPRRTALTSIWSG
jgi:hypothetical protein